MAARRAMLDNEEGPIRDSTKEGIDEDAKFAREFDDISRELKNHHRVKGDFVIKRKTQHNEEMGELARVGVREFTEERLTFRKIPWIVWLAGSIVNIIALYLLYHLALGHWGGVLFKGYNEGHWWQYLLSFILLGLGIAFICAGKVETIIFSKEDGIVTFSKTNCCC